MKKCLLLLTFLSLSAMATGGGKEGHGGDPLAVDFYKRALFALNEMRVKRPVEKVLVDQYAGAYRDLIVEVTDASLPSVGRVLPDPARPGKKMVLLDRAKYFASLVNKQSFDLNSFVAHEVFETVDLDLSPGYEITKRVRFSEERYQRWYDHYVYPSTSPSPVDRFGAFSYSFETGTWGIAWNLATPSEAEANAQARCRAPDCQSLSWVRNGCIAVARSALTSTVASFSWSQSRAKAEADALRSCKALGEPCYSLNSVCTDNAQH